MRVAMALAIVAPYFMWPIACVLRLFADPPFGERQVDGAAWRGLASGPPASRCDRFFLASRGPTSCGLWLTGAMFAAGSSDPQHTPPDALFIVPRTA